MATLQVRGRALTRSQQDTSSEWVYFLLPPSIEELLSRAHLQCQKKVCLTEGRSLLRRAQPHQLTFCHLHWMWKKKVYLAGRRDQPQKTVSPHKDRELLSAISIAGNKRSLTHLAQSSSFQMKERLWCLGPSSFPSHLCTGGNRHHKWLLYKLGSPLFSTNSTQEATNNSKISLIERSRTTAMQCSDSYFQFSFVIPKDTIHGQWCFKTTTIERLKTPQQEHPLQSFFHRYNVLGCPRHLLSQCFWGQTEGSS